MSNSAIRVSSVERNALVPVRDVDPDPEGLDLRAKRLLGRRVAGDEEDTARAGPGEAADPFEQAGLIGVRREAADRPDPGADLTHPAVQLAGRRPLLEVRSERAPA